MHVEYQDELQGLRFQSEDHTSPGRFDRKVRNLGGYHEGSHVRDRGGRHAVRDCVRDHGGVRQSPKGPGQFAGRVDVYECKHGRRTQKVD